MFGFFRKKPVAPAAPPAPAVEEKPQHNRERSERNGRGRNRGRGRGGRERGEERETGRNEIHEDAAKRVSAPAADTQQTQRQPRPPREPREPREGNEARRDRSNTDRQQRQREERKEAPVEELLNAAPVAPAVMPAVVPASEEETLTAVPGTGESEGEEPRRRRRRGGRNRNRRERENSEATGGGEFEAVENKPEQQEAVQLEIAEVVMQTSVTPTLAETAEASDAGTSAASMPAFMPSAQEDSSAEVAKTTPVIDTPETVEAAGVAAEPEPEITQEVTESVPPLQPAFAPVEPVIQAEPAAAEPTLTMPAVEVAAVPASSVQHKSDNLAEVLAAAGLTLAVTDPEKLRAAQEAAARLVPSPRVPRERKSLPPLSNEPLVQIETRR
jgi:ribonuclease E